MTEQLNGRTPAWARTGGFLSIDRNQGKVAGSSAERDHLIEVLHRYAMAYDERDLDVLRSVFADGAAWRGIIQGEPLPAVQGSEAIMDWLADIMDGQLDQRRHLVLNPIIESLEDGAARLVSYIVVTSATPTHGVSIATSGFYDIRFVREGDRWLINDLTAGFDVSF